MNRNKNVTNDFTEDNDVNNDVNYQNIFSDEENNINEINEKEFEQKIEYTYNKILNYINKNCLPIGQYLTYEDIYNFIVYE